MNYDKLYQLAEEYFNGESSVAEEKELRYFLLHEDIPDDLLPLKSQFIAYQQFNKAVLTENFDEKFWNAVSSNKQEAFESRRAVSIFSRDNKSFYYLLSGVAASLLILLTIWTTTDIFKIKNTLNQYNNPALAYQQATDALSILAVNFDKGLSQTQRVAQPLNTSLKMLNNVGMVNRGLESLQPVSKINKMEIIKYNNNH